MFYSSNQRKADGYLFFGGSALTGMLDLRAENELLLIYLSSRVFSSRFGSDFIAHGTVQKPVTFLLEQSLREISSLRCQKNIPFKSRKDEIKI